MRACSNMVLSVLTFPDSLDTNENAVLFLLTVYSVEN